MSLARRLHLLKCAEEAEALIFEDDYDSEIGTRGVPCRRCKGSTAPGVCFRPGPSVRHFFRRCGWGIWSYPRI
jgi:DNA-binding transcriptional MocR family regulator